MRLLVVEDDFLIADQIHAGLRACGHETICAPCAEDALALAEERPFDAVVLDRMLPGISGTDVIADLKQTPGLPRVLMLSALASVKDRVEGLRAGADDYLVKPFDMEELTARLDALARRDGTLPDEAGLRVNSLMLDPARHMATFREGSVELNRKQFSLLAHLMHNADQLVTRRMLLESVWGYSFEPATNIVESNMSRLRSRLQSLGCDAIETRRGAGYVLVSNACV